MVSSKCHARSWLVSGSHFWSMGQFHQLTLTFMSQVLFHRHAGSRDYRVFQCLLYWTTITQVSTPTVWLLADFHLLDGSCSLDASIDIFNQMSTSIAIMWLLAELDGSCSLDASIGKQKSTISQALRSQPSSRSRSCWFPQSSWFPVKVCFLAHAHKSRGRAWQESCILWSVVVFPLRERRPASLLCQYFTLSDSCLIWVDNPCRLFPASALCLAT